MGVLSELFSEPVVAGERRGDVPLVADAQDVASRPMPHLPYAADVQGVDGVPLNYADRSHLVKKVITNRLGRRQTVWVLPTTGGGQPDLPPPPPLPSPPPPPPPASRRPAKTSPPEGKAPASGAVEKLRQGGSLSRDEIAQLPEALAALTVPQLRELQAALGAAGGRVKADRVQKLLALVAEPVPPAAAADPKEVAAALSSDDPAVVAAAVERLPSLDQGTLTSVAVAAGLPEAFVQHVDRDVLAQQLAEMAQDRAADAAELRAAAASWDVPLTFDQQNPDDPVAQAIAADAETRSILEGYLRSTPPDVRAAEDGYEIARRRAFSIMQRMDQVRKADPYDPARSILQARWQAATEAAAAMRDRVAAARVSARVSFVAAAAVPRPMPMQLNKAQYATVRPVAATVSGMSDTDKKALRSASAFLSAITTGPPIAVEVARANDGRAFYFDSFGKGPGVLAMNPYAFTDATSKEQVQGQTQTQVVCHELGHAIEYRKPGVQEAANAFLNYRVGDEKPVDIGGVMAGEMGRKDHFDRVFPPTSALYVGKVYQREASYIAPATEVVSMGVEALFKDPAGFIRKDPEYATFLLGQLRRPV